MKGINDGEYTFGIFLDLSKAFDSINWNKLYTKMERLGLRGICLELVKSYLSNRQQRVEGLDSESGAKRYSDWMTVERGVPQGSILGPLLFLVYVNDLPDVINYETTLYADDTSCIVKTKNPAGNEITETLLKFDNWFRRNDMKLNINKTQIMQFSYFKTNLQLSYQNDTLTTCQSSKFLGLHIDSQLNWKDHVEHLASKLSSFCYALRVISRTINIEAALSAYYAYVYSRIKYGVIFWGCSVESERIFKLQKSCLRSIFGLQSRDSCRNIFKNYNVLTLPAVYVLECVVFVRENYVLFQDQEHIHVYNTRGSRSGHLLPPQTTKSLISKSVVTQPVKIYNHLSNDFKQRDTMTLSKVLRKYLQSNILYDVKDFFSKKLSNF